MDWPEPWVPIIGVSTASALEAELQKELAPGHPLFGLQLRAIARRGDNDDVLFAEESGSRRMAAVHLTWRGSREGPGYPNSTTYNSFADWKRGAQQELFD